MSSTFLKCSTLVISFILRVEELFFQIIKSFLLSKSRGRQFLVLVINLERKMGQQGGDRIEAAVKRPCTSFNSSQNHQVAKIRNENLSLDENMQNN